MADLGRELRDLSSGPWLVVHPGFALMQQVSTACTPTTGPEVIAIGGLKCGIATCQMGEIAVNTIVCSVVQYSTVQYKQCGSTSLTRSGIGGGRVLCCAVLSRIPRLTKVSLPEFTCSNVST